MKNILDKINKADEIQASKVELGTHEVELASKYDFKPFKEEYDKAFVDYRENYRKGITLAKSATDTYSKDLTNLLNKSESLINEFGTKADELGIDFRNTPTYKEFQDLKKIILSSTSNVKEKQKAISTII